MFSPDIYPEWESGRHSEIEFSVLLSTFVLTHTRVLDSAVLLLTALIQVSVVLPE